MKYNFDEVIARRGTNSVKWDEATEMDIIPLWVADMDFRVYPEIITALQKRVEHGIFGYTHVPQSYYESVINWFAKFHHWEGILPQEIIYTSGVVPAISAIIKALTLPGDKVLLMTPVFNCFFSSIRNQGCVVEASPLKYENQTYTVDWEDFEAKCADSRVRLFLLCNPHNPAGRVWTREELKRMGEICRKHHVFVVSDEIHGEVVMPGYHYTPFASIDDFAAFSAVCVAPTKGFNIAGLQIANIIVKDEEKRERIDRTINIHENCDVNPFGVIATEAAYTEGGWEWLNQMNAYVFENYQFLKAYLQEHLPQLPVVKLEGTYLAWIDCESLGGSSKQITEKLYTYGVWVNDGEMYGDPMNRFIRINLACPRSILTEGLRRMVDCLK